MTRPCTVCGFVQPDEDFPVRRSYRIGKCIDCERARRRAWKAAQSPGAQPMIALASLTPDRWTPVARRVRITAKQDGWEWDLSPREVSVLQIAIAHGSVTLAERREPDGSLVKLAKRARSHQREGLEFAVAGMGMFER